MKRWRYWLALISARRIGAFALAIALLLPVFFAPTLQLKGATYAYLFVIDVSESMNVRDVPNGAPDESRLDRAKTAVAAALAALPCGSRVAVGLFAGADVLPLFEPIEVCRHYPAIEQVVRGIDWRMAWDGDSRVEAAVVAALREAGQRGLDLVFLSDGDEAPHVTVPHFGELLALQGKVRGIAIGVGGPQPRPVPRLDADNRIVGYWSAVDAVREGFYPNLSELVKQDRPAAELERTGAFDEVREHQSALDAEYLKQVATAAGLRYAEADTPQRVVAAVADPQLARHEDAERDMRIVFGFASALFVVIGWVQRREDLRETRARGLPQAGLQPGGGGRPVTRRRARAQPATAPVTTVPL